MAWFDTAELQKANHWLERIALALEALAPPVTERETEPETVEIDDYTPATENDESSDLDHNVEYDYNS